MPFFHANIYKNSVALSISCQIHPALLIDTTVSWKKECPSLSWCHGGAGDNGEIIEMYGIDKAQRLSKDDYGIKYNASLWISDASEHDTGTYSCIVNTSRLVEESIIVQDYEFYPSIIVSSLTLEYLFSQNEADNITLQCPNEVVFRH